MNNDAGPLEHVEMVFVRADSFDFMRLGQLPLLPTVLLSGLEVLQEAILVHKATCGSYGVYSEIDGEPSPLFAEFHFVVSGIPMPIAIWLDDATEGWVSYAMRQFTVAWPAGDDGERAWFATGKMNEFVDGVMVPSKLGRNDPCPCNSGLKYKRCHGR